MSRAFTPRSVEAMRPRIERLAGELLDAARARGGMDVMEDYAFPLRTFDRWPEPCDGAEVAGAVPMPPEPVGTAATAA